MMNIRTTLLAISSLAGKTPLSTKHSAMTADVSTARNDHNATDSATFSEEGRRLSREDNDGANPDGAKLLVQAVNENPASAAKMAQEFAYAYDGELVDLKDLRLDDPAWVAQYEKGVKAFEAEMLTYREHRIAIYTQMTEQGATGAEIFKAIMTYNKSLPSEYLEKTGLNKLLDYI